MSTADRRGMLDRDDPNLSVRAQCAMLGLCRSGVYRQRAANDDDDLALMRRIDELFLQHPFLGSRRMAQMLSDTSKNLCSPHRRRKIGRFDSGLFSFRFIDVHALRKGPPSSGRFLEVSCRPRRRR